MKEKHQGEIVEQIVRNSGYRLVHIAEKMNMSRNTLYVRFKEKKLNPYFLFQLGKVIGHDFRENFPLLSRTGIYHEEVEKLGDNKELFQLQSKYYHVLEDYNALLKFLVKIINENELYTLKREIDSFLKDGFG